MKKLLLASIVTAFILPMGAGRVGADGMTTNKLILDAELAGFGDHKCKIDAVTWNQGFCNLKGTVEIDGIKATAF